MLRHRIVAASLFAAACVLAPRAAAAQTFEYAVKIVCGNPDPLTVPGRFATVINVHNPTPRDARFRIKVAVAVPDQGGPITAFRNLGLRPDGALAIPCRTAQAMANQSILDGFVVIQSAVELDVVAVYTAAGSTGVSTMAVERVPPRRMQQ